MQRYLYDCGVRCNTLDVIVMNRHASVIGSHTGLWTMMLSAGVLAVLLACAGTAAGAAWVVDDDGGAGVGYTMLAGGGRC